MKIIKTATSLGLLWGLNKMVHGKGSAQFLLHTSMITVTALFVFLPLSSWWISTHSPRTVSNILFASKLPLLFLLNFPIAFSFKLPYDSVYIYVILSWNLFRCLSPPKDCDLWRWGVCLGLSPHHPTLPPANIWHSFSTNKNTHQINFWENESKWMNKWNKDS